MVANVCVFVSFVVGDKVDALVAIVSIHLTLWLYNHLLYITNCAMRQNCAYIIIFGDLQFLGLITVVILSYRAVQTLIRG